MSEKIPSETLTQLKNEIKMSMALNREELEPIVVEGINRYTGKHVPPYGMNWDIVLNEVYPIIQNHLPSIFYRNPKAFLKPKAKTYTVKKRDPVSGQMVQVEMDSTKSAKTQEHILNYCLDDIRYKKEVQKVLLDALLFPFGVLWHGYKGDFGMTEEQSLYIKKDNIFVRRLNPLRFIKDPAVNIANIEEARWVGRVFDVPLLDILEDDQLDVDKKLIKGIPGFGEKIGKASREEYLKAGGQDFLRASSYLRSIIDFAEKDYKGNKGARFVRISEIFLRPTKKQQRNGEKGKIVLLTDEQPTPLRISEWSIRAEGFPSKILEFNPLNDGYFGVPDVETYKQIADQKNIITNLQIRNAQENSKVWVALAKGNSDEEDIAKIKNGDQTIILFEGDTVTGKMSVASAGGAASNELYLIDQRIQRNLDEKSGINDLRKGFLQSGEESATSVRYRMAGTSARALYRQDIMSDFLKESMKYINQLCKQFIPYEKAVRIVGSLDLQWSEKPTEESVLADTDVEIDAISMLPEDPQTELQNLNSILSLMVQGLTNPQMAQKLAQEGKTVNISPLIEQILMRMRIRDPEIFRSIQPQESMGVVQVQQLREAKENVVAAITGQQIQFPPNPQDDHVAKLEIYTTIQQLLQLANQQSEQLDALIQIQTQLLQQKMNEEAMPGNVVKPLPQPKVMTT